MAGTLILLLPLTLAWWSPRRQRRRVGFGLALLMIAALVLTQSRGAFLALVVAGILALVWGRFRLRWLVAAAVALLLLFLFVLALTPLESKDLSAALNQLDASSKSGSTEA